MLRTEILMSIKSDSVSKKLLPIRQVQKKNLKKPKINKRSAHLKRQRRRHLLRRSKIRRFLGRKFDQSNDGISHRRAHAGPRNEREGNDISRITAIAAHHSNTQISPSYVD